MDKATFSRPNGELSKQFGVNQRYKLGLAWEIEKKHAFVGAI